MPKFGKVNTPIDITNINNDIRKLVSTQKTKDALMKRRAESAYLYTLTFSPAWKKKFSRDMLTRLKLRAKTQYTDTARLINTRFKKLKINEKVDTILN